MRTTRSVAATSSKLCVTMMIVSPSSRFSAQQLHDLAAGRRVEVAGRLVGQQDPRLARSSPGDGRPLHLAAGQLARLVLEPMAQADAVQDFHRRRFMASAARRTNSRTDWSIIAGISTFSSAESSGSRW